MEALSWPRGGSHKVACVCMQERECLETYLIGILGLEEGRDVGAWANVMPVREEGPGIAGG